MGKIDREFVGSFKNLELLAKEVVQGFMTGLHKSPFRGFSVEFAEHRHYNRGESTRHIDWKLYGRTDKLFIKEYEEETNLRASFIIDASPSMFYPEKSEKQLSKFQYSIYGAAVLMELLQRQRDAFALNLFDRELYFDSEMKSTPAHKQFLFSQLESELNKTKEKQQGTDLVNILHQKAETLPARSLVVIFTDFFVGGWKEELWEAFRHLAHKNHDMVVFHVNDRRSEHDLELNTQWARIIDAETGEEIKLNPEQYQKSYREKISEQNLKIKTELLNLRTDYYVVDIQDDFENLMRAYLSRRKKILQSR
ncbi:DUF58 domain-containing protein [Luteibaculum oceani]|uniref:DUF58 domain-containing protein n=1 Tax=Luteibaculum oceani TaxID=1294296 RepID=A0A5C6UYQ2_9FLAO|nr:DUF58 domain-containing protein [Luteibaculum oceani]TXC78613.1 DUF58 domain-containing protein [Luteibaculum oceani]